MLVEIRGTMELFLRVEIGRKIENHMVRDDFMITSVQNEKVKRWQKLKMKKERIKTGTFLIEGSHLIEEALNSEWQVSDIILKEGTGGLDGTEDIDTYIVSEHVFKSITETKTPQGIAAIVEMRQPKWNEFSHVLMLDAIQDPGNLGTIIRTADAAGFDAVVLGTGSVDLYNDKVIRATQGSVFHLPVFQENLSDRISLLKRKGFTIWASALKNSVPFNQLALPDKVGLIVGNEGAGIDGKLIEMADETVQIPIRGKAESLNVSVAAGILLYHLKD